MDSVTPEKNEDAFKNWERYRKWLELALWAPLVLFLPATYRLLCLLTPLEEPAIPEPWIEAVPWLEVANLTEWVETLIIMGASLFYVTIAITVREFVLKHEVHRLSKEACIFSAIVAAQDLERGDPVRASLSMGKLLVALSDYLGQKLVPSGLTSAAASKYTAPSKYMQVIPKTIPKTAVFRAIQASGDTKDFQERLCDLAIGLHGNEDAGYLAVHQFLVWLDRRAEPYRQISQSFLDKHAALRNMLQTTPVIIPAVSVIVVELVRIVHEVPGQ